MNIVSKLTLPALVGGLVALAVSGVFSPSVMAGSQNIDTIARISLDRDQTLLTLYAAPGQLDQAVGQLEPRLWVWVDRCMSDKETGSWCRVERGQSAGWVEARSLSLHWD